MPTTPLASARSLLAALAITLAGTQSALAGVATLKPYANALPDEAKSQTLCESVPGRIFVKAAAASECVAFFVTKGNESKRHAVLFLDGDINLEKYQDQAALAAGQQDRRKFMQRWADKTGQRYADISRLGVNGSSGNHGARRMPRETVIMNEAINILKARLGLDTITLAGQSGGSTIAASLLTFGRPDVTCAVLGSGAYDLVDLEAKFREGKGAKVDRAAMAKAFYDPSQHVADIAKSPARRIFIVGDAADTKTPWEQQVRFARAIGALGHHVRALPIDARGDTDHGAAHMTLPIAGTCARGDTDERIERGVPKRKEQVSAK